MFHQLQKPLNLNPRGFNFIFVEKGYVVTMSKASSSMRENIFFWRGGRRVQGGDNSNFVLSLRMGCNCGTSSAGEVTTQP